MTRPDILSCRIYISDISFILVSMLHNKVDNKSFLYSTDPLCQNISFVIFYVLTFVQTEKRGTFVVLRVSIWIYSRNKTFARGYLFLSKSRFFSRLSTSGPRISWFYFSHTKILEWKIIDPQIWVSYGNTLLVFFL